MKECIEGQQSGLSFIAVSHASSGCPVWKRALDVFVVLLVLPIVLPVMLLVALVIRVVSKGPVFFKQERIGYLGKPFTVWKFRTMHANADARIHQEHVKRLIAQNLPLTKLDAKGDRRLIPGGALLRASAVDELPQLFNVLLGDMSLVGPRPCMDYEYHQLLPWHRQRFKTPPGMTGLWQVKRGPETSFQEMMQMDLRYVANRTVWLDMSILCETVPAVLTQAWNSWSAKRVQRQQREQHAL